MDDIDIEIAILVLISRNDATRISANENDKIGT